jgi:hypothetical protein
MVAHGPLVHCASPRTRLRRWPGPGFLFSHLGRDRGPFITELPFLLDGHRWISVEQNHQHTLSGNPSAHFPSSFPFPFLCTVLDRAKWGGQPVSDQRRRAKWGRRWCHRRPRRQHAHRPMGGHAAVERLLDGALPMLTPTDLWASVMKAGVWARYSSDSFPHDTPSSSGRHGRSHAHNSEWWLKIYLCGVWFHPQSMVVAMRIKPKVSPCNPSILYLVISF